MTRIVAILSSLAAVWRCRRALLIWAMDCSVYNWAMRWIVPRIRFTWRHAQLPDWKIERGYNLLEPGDIILSRSDGQLTTWVVPGEWTHAALCLVKPFGYVELERAFGSIAEMVAAGYTRSDFVDVCRASRVGILRCTDWARDPEYTQQVIDKCKSFDGTGYDRQFGLGDWLLSCAELIWHSDVEKRADVKLSSLLGLRNYITPQDYMDAAMNPTSNLEVVWDSDKETLVA